MGPCSTIWTQHVTSMSHFIKVKKIVIFLGDFFGCHTNGNPLILTHIYSKGKGLNAIEKIQFWIHQSHLINRVLFGKNPAWTENFNTGMVHLVWEFVKSVLPKGGNLLVDIFHFSAFLDKILMEILHFDVNNVIYVFTRVLKKNKKRLFVRIIAFVEPSFVFSLKVLDCPQQSRYVCF